MPERDVYRTQPAVKVSDENVRASGNLPWHHIIFNSLILQKQRKHGEYMNLVDSDTVHPQQREYMSSCTLSKKKKKNTICTDAVQHHSHVCTLSKSWDISQRSSVRTGEVSVAAGSTCTSSSFWVMWARRPAVQFADSPEPDNIESLIEAEAKLRELYLLHKILFLSFFFFFNTGSNHSDNKLPTATAHSLPAPLGTNTNSPPHQMEAAVIKTLSSATVLCKTQQRTHTTTERAC